MTTKAGSKQDDGVIRAVLNYGDALDVDIFLGPDAWYVVHGDGKGGGVVLRETAEYASDKVTRAVLCYVVLLCCGAVVRNDTVPTDMGHTTH